MNFPKIFSDRNSKFTAYVNGVVNHLTPRYLLSYQIKQKLKYIKDDPNYDYIMSRVNYYNKLKGKAKNSTLGKKALSVGDFKHRKQQLMYYIDLNNAIRGFDKKYRYNALFGDITVVPPEPTFVKSRPIAGDNCNSVLLKLNSIRHFNFVKKDIPYTQKADSVIFRGKIALKPHRIDFFEKYFNHPMFNLGDTSTEPSHDNKEWLASKISLAEQLKNKFVLCIEGNDVCTSLKWVMSSNSIAVMPRPKYETWFMEGKLIPNVHYIEIADDYSDAVERVNYYIEHEDEALEIIKNANRFVAQFKDKKQERIIGWLVAHKYFNATNGNTSN